MGRVSFTHTTTTTTTTATTMSLDPVSAVISALKREGLIPDVLPESFSPSMLFSIIYPNGKEVLMGNEFQIDEAADEPQISFMPMSMPAEQADSAGEEVAYTLAMLDPDVPSRADPQNKAFRHWVVSDSHPMTTYCTRLIYAPITQISGLKSPAHSASAVASSAALKTQSAITPYMPPGPRPGTGWHRYGERSDDAPCVWIAQGLLSAFLLFQEPSAAPFILPDGAHEFKNEDRDDRRRWNGLAFAEKYGLKLVGANFMVVQGPPGEE